jgi:glyoxylase-like metal-dependent hydrolase (beta-lactamase superfamily II)
VELKSFFDPDTFTFTYLLYCPEKKSCVIIDPVLNYSPESHKVYFETINKLTSFVQKNQLQVEYILETHVHADHLSGIHMLKEIFPKAKTAIGSGIKQVYKDFAGTQIVRAKGGDAFDVLLEDSHSVDLGPLSFKVLATPGHTPACCCYLFRGHLFTGDALFMPDFGTARCDFPSGSAQDLYASVTEKIFPLPDETKVFVGHDYGVGHGPDGSQSRPIANETTIAMQRESNVHINRNTNLKDFLELRETRDSQLSPPKLMVQSLQVNLNGGRLPVDERGQHFLIVPVFIDRT